MARTATHTSGTGETLERLVSMAIAQGIGISGGECSVADAVTVIGEVALRTSASGATINTAMTEAARSLRATGAVDAAAAIPSIARGVVSFLLMTSIVPELRGSLRTATSPSESPRFIPLFPA